MHRFARGTGFSGYRFPAEAGITGMVLRKHHSVFVEDYASHPSAMPEFVDAGLASNLVMPLMGRNGPVGVLAMSWFKERGESPNDYRLALAERVVGQLAVVFERWQLQERLEQVAREDALTGLANRKWTMEVLQARISGSFSLPCAVVLVDLDGFKTVNDAHGHAAGDMMLRDVARRLRDVTRSGDTIGRLGGDEFVVIMPGVSAQDAVDTVLGRINTALCIPLAHGGGTRRISASIGVACYPADGTDAESLKCVATS